MIYIWLLMIVDASLDAKFGDLLSVRDKRTDGPMERHTGLRGCDGRIQKGGENAGRKEKIGEMKEFGEGALAREKKRKGERKKERERHTDRQKELDCERQRSLNYPN